MTFNDLKFETREGRKGDLLSGVQALVFFSNGYGASVIKGRGSYGSDKDLYELAVVKTEGDSWDLCYDTHITDDVIGFLTEDGITHILGQIEAL
jgi:hypothetical protein